MAPHEETPDEQYEGTKQPKTEGTEENINSSRRKFVTGASGGFLAGLTHFLLVGRPAARAEEQAPADCLGTFSAPDSDSCCSNSDSNDACTHVNADNCRTGTPSDEGGDDKCHVLVSQDSCPGGGSSVDQCNADSPDVPLG